MTREHRNLLDAIQRLTQRGVAPSYKELAAATGCKSKGTIHLRINWLKAEGHVHYEPKKWATLVVLTDNPAYTPPVLASLPTDQLQLLSRRVLDTLTERLR